MKNLYIITAAILLITSCKKDNIAKQDQFDKSYKAWVNYKSSINNSYNFATGYSSWVGFTVDIKMSVSNGKIVSRNFTMVQSHLDGSGIKDTVKNWHEDAAQINTHGTEGGELMTIDDIYTKARTFWLKADTKTNDIYFETDKNGLLSSCGFVPKGCQDDCFNGVTITAFQKL